MNQIRCVWHHTHLRPFFNWNCIENNFKNVLMSTIKFRGSINIFIHENVVSFVVLKKSFKSTMAKSCIINSVTSLFYHITVVTVIEEYMGLVYLRTKVTAGFLVDILYVLSLHLLSQHIHATVFIAQANTKYKVVLWSLLFCHFFLQTDIDEIMIRW